jgi:hypothetical protein
MEFINFGLRSGSDFFYSVFSFGTQRININTRDENKNLIGRNEHENILVWRGGFGVEFTMEKFFIDLDATTGGIMNAETYGGNISSLFQTRLTMGVKIFEHLGVFGGISYDYIHRINGSPDPRRFLGFIAGRSNDWNTHKLGFFAGLQF